MPTVYVETTIPSFYFETRTSARIVAWREATRRWWTLHRDRYALVTSVYVLNELSAAPRAKAGPALELLRDITVIEASARVPEIVREYIRAKVMPADAVGDAAHLAVASLHRIDFLMTWNCRHLANANKVPHIRAVNERLGLSVPILATPLNLDPGE